ncbi:hypothetical protein DPMN_104801 [Dreissena polymorpha]|uniref:Uncharacterized protein n=1 Tax=Dreissena polymorpha TaxID=45954 RepID=A0A9D4K2W1_DREPO|nr:hypothetical protein DPMN_104801 [Dreissena polymorpha]
MTYQAIARLSRLWTISSITFPTKYKLYKSLDVYILLYGGNASNLLHEAEDQHLLVYKSLYWRLSKDERWLVSDTSPGTTLCARLFSRAR